MHSCGAFCACILAHINSIKGEKAFFLHNLMRLCEGWFKNSKMCIICQYIFECFGNPMFFTSTFKWMNSYGCIEACGNHPWSLNIYSKIQNHESAWISNEQTLHFVKTHHLWSKGSNYRPCHQNYLKNILPGLLNFKVDKTKYPFQLFTVFSSPVNHRNENLYVETFKLCYRIVFAKNIKHDILRYYRDELDCITLP